MDWIFEVHPRHPAFVLQLDLAKHLARLQVQFAQASEVAKDRPLDPGMTSGEVALIRQQAFADFLHARLRAGAAHRATFAEIAGASVNPDVPASLIAQQRDRALGRRGRKLKTPSAMLGVVVVRGGEALFPEFGQRVLVVGADQRGVVVAGVHVEQAFVPAKERVEGAGEELDADSLSGQATLDRVSTFAETSRTQCAHLLLGEGLNGHGWEKLVLEAEACLGRLRL